MLTGDLVLGRPHLREVIELHRCGKTIRFLSCITHDRRLTIHLCVHAIDREEVSVPNHA